MCDYLHTRIFKYPQAGLYWLNFVRRNLVKTWLPWTFYVIKVSSLTLVDFVALAVSLPTFIFEFNIFSEHGGNDWIVADIQVLKLKIVNLNDLLYLHIHLYNVFVEG